MLDTNLLVSAFLFPESRLAHSVMNIAERHWLVLSSFILLEFRRIIERKFSQKHSAADEFINSLQFAMSYTPEDIDPDIFPYIRDKKDYPVLASAILSDVDIFVTGDKDFEGLSLDTPAIMNIREFADMYLIT